MEAIRLALRHKADLAGMVAAAAERALELVQGPSVGAVWLLSQLARDLGIVAADPAGIIARARERIANYKVPGPSISST